MRETVEELAIPSGDLESVVFLGMAREFMRLGHPELFYLIRTNRSFDEVREHVGKATDSWEHKGIDQVSKKLLGGGSEEWAQEILLDLVTEPLNPISKAGLFFLIAYWLGPSRPGPLGTGGQTWAGKIQ